MFNKFELSVLDKCYSKNSLEQLNEKIDISNDIY